MKTNKKWSVLALLAFVVVSTSCKVDEIDVNNSIFDTNETELTGFDKWIDDNYRLTYNIQFYYKYNDLETDMTFNLIPAMEEKTVQIAQLIKYLWLDAYTEVAGLAFTRQYCPRVLFMVGSSAWKTETRVLGTAESGLKVILYNINELNPKDGEEMTESYFKTMHHEFAHILHQTKMFDLSFAEWGAEHYVGGAWSDRSDAYAAKRGFVSAYSMHSVNEDFVEVFALYLTQPDEWWDEWRLLIDTPSTTAVDNETDLTPDEAWDIIQQKIDFLRDYMQDYWNLDIDQLRSVVRRRTEEVASLQLIEEF